MILPGALLFLGTLIPTSSDLPLTRAERSNYQETSTYQDVLDFLGQLQDSGARIRIDFIGKSTEGRDIPLVLVSNPPVATPQEAKKTGKAIVYIQANIHAGEVEGKESAQALIRELSLGPLSPLLEKLILVVCPIYNIDGNERFGEGSRNRPGQTGPDRVGVRANGQGLDLNRDCMKVASPEMAAVLKHVYNYWDPDIVMDLHTTNGTRHGYPLTYAPPLHPATYGPLLEYSRSEFIPEVRKQLQAQGMETFDYGNAANRGGRRVWESFGAEGRYVTNYAGLRNRIGVLSESMSYEPFENRVKDTTRFVTQVLRTAATHASDITKLTRDADAAVTEWGLRPSIAPELAVRFALAEGRVEGVLMEKPRAEGAPPNRGPVRDIEVVEMPVFDRFAATQSASFPAAYIVPEAEKAVLELLLLHGVVVEQITSPWSGEAQIFTIDTFNEAAQPFQNVRLATANGSFTALPTVAHPGSYLVRTAQPLGILAFSLLEPESTDGVLAWRKMASELAAGSRYPIVKVMTPVRASTVRVQAAPSE